MIKLEVLTDKAYKVFNGTYYSAETPNEMVLLLNRLYYTGMRYRFHWGDIKTGQDWGDDCDVKGRISRSTGRAPIPILIHNCRSMGGGAILAGCIVKITATKGGRVIYQHPNYKEAK